MYIQPVVSKIFPEILDFCQAVYIILSNPVYGIKSELSHNFLMNDGASWI